MSVLFAAAASTLVFCAPGYPGVAADAQPYVDQFATAAVTAAGWKPGSLAAVYDPTEKGGLEKLGAPDAVLTFVPYPFYVEHAAELRLVPLAQADVADLGTKQKWTLVAKSGGVADGPSLAGYTIASVAGYAPSFVIHSALAAWKVPEGVKVEAAGQILSVLRKVSAGDKQVALLDQPQAAALPTLPFAKELRPVIQSAELPVAIIAVVAGRLPASQTKTFQAGLLKLGQQPGAAEVLSSLKLKGFVMPQVPALPAATSAASK